MTSKNLCFKLMKEDLKRRVWTIALLILTFFFSVIIPLFMTVSERSDYEIQEEWLDWMSRQALELLGHDNPFVTLIVVIAAVVCAVSGFSYLHSAKKVDLYHSIPVKRGTLFMANYFNGVLMMAVIYLAAQLAGTVIAASAGVGFRSTFPVAMAAYGFHMAYYCLLYTTMILAMLLTGNIIIALLGNLVFWFYGPGVAGLVYTCVEVWFETYFYKSHFLGADFFSKISEKTSPFINFIRNYEKFWDNSLLLVIGTTLLVTVVLAAFCYWVYKKRPSEAAGKAMAFQKTMAPIKILLVIPISLAFGIFFWAIRSTMGWAVFGILCGGLITHCLMEIIYHFDFRKLFCHKMHLVLCIAASLFILCGFKYDWFGYDSYLPKGSEVKSAAITANSIDNWVTYGSVDKREIGRAGSGEFYYNWAYSDAEDYAAEHMEITDIADILSIARKAIQLNQQTEGNDSGYRWDYDRGFQKFTIQYTLNNGRKVIRQYSVYDDMIQEELNRIYDSQEYKMGSYPLLSQTAEDTARINFQQFNHIVKVGVEPQTEEMKALLEAYQTDFKSLTMETCRNELPIATIQFVTRDLYEPVYEYGSRVNENEYYYRVHNLVDRCYYPVYPSFTRTIELLEQAGVEVKRELQAEMISKVSISDYRSKEAAAETTDVDTIEFADTVAEEAAKTTVYENPEELKALAPALISYDYYHMNPMNQTAVEYQMDVTVYLKDENNGKIITCYLDKTKMPDFLK